MAKAKKPDFEKINQLKPPAIYTENKIDGDFTHIVRSAKPKCKQKNEKIT